MQKTLPNPGFISVDLEITNLCNNRCLMCPRDAITRVKGLMDEETFDAVLSAIKGTRPLVTFSGMGDPLLHPECLQFVKRLRDAGLATGLVIPPGSLLEPDVIETFVKARPNQVTVSFPSSRKAVFETLCPDVLFDEALDATKRLFLLSRGKFGLRVSGLITEINPDEKEEYIKFWKELGIHSWIRKCHGRGGNLKDSLIYKRKRVGLDNRPCSLFFFHSFITWEGDVLACCHDLTNETKICNITEGVDEIISRKQKILSRIPHFPLCRTCDEPFRNIHLTEFDISEEMSRRRFFKRLE